MKTWIQSLAILTGLTLITGVIYPLAVTGIGSWVWPAHANGSLMSDATGIRGSLLLSQKSADPKWFWPRPSAGDYATLPSGASNLSPSNKALRDQVEKQRAQFQGEREVPAELLLNSASGLDPHVSPAGAKLQIPRICQARELDPARCKVVTESVEASIEHPTLGFLGRSRVNVNTLNRLLAEQLR